MRSFAITGVLGIPLVWAAFTLLGTPVVRAQEEAAEPEGGASAEAPPRGTPASKPAPEAVLDYKRLGLTGFDQKLYAGVGVYTPSMLGTASTEGGPAFFGPVQPEVHLQGAIPVFADRVLFSPWIAYTPVALKHSDGAGSVRRLLFALEGSYVVFPYLSASLGTGMTQEFRRAGGGVMNMVNGNSTQDFYLPEGGSVTRVFFWDVALGYRAMERIRLDFRFVMAGRGATRFSPNLLAQLSIGVF